MSARNFLLLICFSSAIGISFGLNQPITDDTWSRMLEGEWMVKFYAPWCPACRHIAPVWNSFALKAESLGIQVGDVDITKESSLSGRFLVTSLPTLYHVRNGEFRKYEGPRSARDFEEFIKEEKWRQIEPLPWWKSPSSILMSFLGLLFKFSVALKEVHEWLTVTHGLSPWMSYGMFGIATVAFGLLLGLIMVFVTDYLMGTQEAPRRIKRADEGETDKKDQEGADSGEQRGENQQNTAEPLRKRNVKSTTD